MISPILLLLGDAGCAQLGRPVLFSQVRPGYFGRPFKVYKFRTHDGPDVTRRATCCPTPSA